VEKVIVQPTAFRILTGLAILAATPYLGAADDDAIPAKIHPWATFDPGAWKTVHVVTETLNEQGKIVSSCVTDTRTTLLDITRSGVILEIQACMVVGGKRFEGEPQIVKQGFHGEAYGPCLRWKPQCDGEVLIEKQKFPCKVLQFECDLPNGKADITLHYSLTVPPFVLKRETCTTDQEGKTVSETSVDTTALNAPLSVKIHGEEKKGVRVKTVHKTANGVVTTWTDIFPSVPGGVVSNSMKELDKAGHLVRRSNLELVDYNTAPDPDRLNYKRSQRHRAKAPNR
jgi:hypothetical protein